MKTTILLLWMFVTINVSFAQIPNDGFESWINMGTYENPVSWGTLNDHTASTGIFTATKGSPGSPGSYYLKLTSKTVNNGVLNGIAVSGVLDTVSFLPVSGFPFSQRPQSFTGKWQHMINGSSQGSVSVSLTRWNGSLSKRDTVATALQTLSGMAMSWASFSIDFIYQSVDNPDSCIIVLKSSGTAPTQGDYLWVDNLAFYGVVSGLSDIQNQGQAILVFPNPAGEYVTFSSSFVFQPGDKIFLTDQSGRVVCEKSLEESVFSISVHGLDNGSYTYSIINRFGVRLNGGKLLVFHP